ncbi:MAG: osmotically-inducible lipoprotein OsmB [Alcaligenaceae bacterium]|jgi:osmotically inducible lipoprotein OsmB|nr:osmotically-inducible lipoprotein OsmB [Alcaligenaceae bacterium]
MKTTIGKYFVLAALIGSLAACSNMSSRDRSTVAGAAIGGGAGALISDGDGWSTVGGAAVGGLIGNQLGK